MRCKKCMRQIESVQCSHCGYDNTNNEPKAAFHLMPGTVLHGQYTIGLALGNGGFGVTYIAYDDVLHRTVAIKEYLPSEFATRATGVTQVSIFNNEMKQEQYEKGLNRFIEEGQKLAKFNHIAVVVSVYDCFIENSTGYIVMEYLEGLTLKDYIKQSEKLSYEEVLEIMVPIMEALEEVHEDGLIHRDIAPDNIYLTVDQGPKLLDFGAARFATTSHSKSLSVILKLGYAPEEQYQSKGEQGSWTDVYALCATMVHALTGKIPQESVERLADDQIKPLGKVGVKLPKHAEITIMNGMNIRHDNRIQTMRELKESLLGEKHVVRKKEKGLVEDIGQWPRWMKLTVSTTVVSAVVLVALLVTGVIDFRMFMSDINADWVEEANVPRLINHELEAAIELSNDAGFQITTAEGKVESDIYAKDMVIEQSLEAGKLANTTETIEVTISAGPMMIEVGYLMNRDVYETKEMLENLGFVVEIEEIENQEYFKGAVVTQSVEPYTEYGRKGKIILQYASGNTDITAGQPTQIPDITGMGIDEARKVLMDAGLYMKLTESVFTDSDDDIDDVATQSKTGSASTGDFIEVEISKGVMRFYMPDVELQTQSNALKQLVELGAKEENISVTEVYNQNRAKGQIVSQSIESGTRITTNDKIELEVSIGPSEFTIPNLTGMNVDEAKNLLISQQIPSNIIHINEVNSETVHSNNVVEQSIQAGGILHIEDSITLTKSLGGVESEWVSSLPAGVDDSNYEITVEQEYRVKPAALVEGEWSSWVSGTGTASEYQNVKHQFRTQTIEFKESNQSSLAGYTQYKDPLATVGTNCTESTTPSSSSASVKVTTYTTSETVWSGWTYFGYFSTRVGTGGVTVSNKHEAAGASVYDGSGNVVDSIACDTVGWEYARNTKEDYPVFSNTVYGTLYSMPTSSYVGGACNVTANVFYRVDEYSEEVTTHYKSCPISYTYYYTKTNAWTGWSEGTGPSSTDTLNVEVQYATQEITKQPAGDWGEWSQTYAEENDLRYVEVRDVYKYRFR